MPGVMALPRSVILALKRMRQENREFKARMGYRVRVSPAGLHSKNIKRKRITKNMLTRSIFCIIS
jgi:hypothetical protein